MDGFDGPPQAGGEGPCVRRMIRAGIAGLFAAILMACSSGDDPPAQVVEASATIGAEGGTVTGPDGVVVKIPAGALTEPTVIRIARTAAGSPSAPPDGYTVGDKVYEITPHDLVFLYPVTIEMPWTAGANDQLPFKASPSDVWLPVGATIDGGTASWLANSFSWFMVGVCAPRTDDPYSCVTPNVQPSVVSSIADAITKRHSGPESIAWTVTKATTLDITLNYSAAADCGDAKLTVTRRANGGRLAATLIDTAVPLSTDPENAKRRRGNHLWQLPMSEADNGLGAYDVRFSCQRPGRSYRASAGGTLMFYGDNIAPLPAVAPTFVTQPANATVTVGMTATFSASASGTPAPTLQWQRSTDGATWVDIAGATAATHTTSATTITDDGNQFRVVATNTAGSESSIAATLTVKEAATTVWSAASTIQALGTNYDPAAGIDGSDRALAVWMAYPPGQTTARAYFASASASGGGWSAPALIDGGVNGYETRLAVATDGRAVAAWGYAIGSAYHLAAARFDGSAWGPVVRVDTSLSGNSSEHHLAADDTGRALLVWSQPDAGGRYGVYASIDAGAGWSSPAAIDRGAISGVISMAVNGTGRGFVVFSETSDTVIAVPVDLGSGFGSPQVIREKGRSVGTSRVTVDADGNALAIWIDSTDGGDRLRWSRSTGNTGWSAPADVDAIGWPFARNLALAGSAGGDAAAVWMLRDGDGKDAIWTRRFSTAGGWGALERLSTVGRWAESPNAAMNASGRLVVSWKQSDETNSIYQTWARVHDGTWHDAQRLASSSQDGRVDWQRALAVGASGRAVVLWSEYSSGSDEPLLGAFWP